MAKELTVPVGLELFEVRTDRAYRNSDQGILVAPLDRNTGLQ